MCNWLSAHFGWETSKKVVSLPESHRGVKVLLGQRMMYECGEMLV